jgi:hypothetical protein
MKSFLKTSSLVAGLVAAGVVVLFHGCQQTTMTSANEGERLYRAKCVSCHHLVASASLTPEQWRARLEHHGPKMTDAQRSALLGYLTGQAPDVQPDVRNASVQGTSNFTLLPGDLLFQDLDAGPLCDAIEQVTRGYDDTNLSHVGLVARDANEALVVIEAVSAGVVATPLHRFLARSLDEQRRPKVLVGRLNPAAAPACRQWIPQAIEQARALEGSAYDRRFLIGNDSYYCSELIYEVFRRVNHGRPVFDLQPMTFRKPGSEEPFPAWRTYFSDLGVAIPEGRPGINPGSLSRAPVLTIVHEYGAVTRKPALLNAGAPAERISP